MLCNTSRVYSSSTSASRSEDLCDRSSLYSQANFSAKIISLASSPSISHSCAKHVCLLLRPNPYFSFHSLRLFAMRSWSFGSLHVARKHPSLSQLKHLAVGRPGLRKVDCWRYLEMFFGCRPNRPCPTNCVSLVCFCSWSSLAQSERRNVHDGTIFPVVVFAGVWRSRSR